MTAPVFIGSNIYRGSSYGPRHPLSIPRVPTVIDLSRAMGWLPPEQYRISPRAKPEALAAWHCPRYLAALQRAEAEGEVSPETRARHNLGTLSNPVFSEMFRRPATAAGGSLLAATLLARGGAVYNPGGGTHHGMADHAAGFCYLNDPVLAIRAFLDQGLTRVAYVDIDAHHCDGVAAAFQAEPRVLMISTHEANRWPFTGALEDRAGGSAINLPLPRGTNDTGFTMALQEVILPAVQDMRPQAIILQCGAPARGESGHGTEQFLERPGAAVVEATVRAAAKSRHPLQRLLCRRICTFLKEKQGQLAQTTLTREVEQGVRRLLYRVANEYQRAHGHPGVLVDPVAQHPLQLRLTGLTAHPRHEPAQRRRIVEPARCLEIAEAPIKAQLH